MKKVINGKMYDTDKAKCLGEWDNGIYGFDFDAIYEALHRKRTGEFFLYGKGGARTQYAEPRGQNSWGGGERIMPLSYSEAQEWAEDHLDGEEYEQIFGEIVEDESSVTVTINLSAAANEKLNRLVSQKGISKGAVIEELLNSAEQ